MTDMTASEMTCDRFAEGLADYLEGDAPEAVRDAIDAHAVTCPSCSALLAELMAIPHEAAALPMLVPSRDLWSGIADRIDTPVVPLVAHGAVRAVPSLRRGWVRPAIAAAALVVFTASVTHVLTRAAMTPVDVALTQPAQRSRTVPSAPDDAPAAAPAAAPDAAPEPGAPTADLTSTASERPPSTVVSPRAAASRAEPAGRSATPTRAHGGTVRLASAEPLLREAEPVYDREISKLRKIVHERHSQLDPATIAVLEQSVAVIDSAIAQSRAALAKDPASGFLATQLNHSLEKKVELLRTAALLPART